VLVLLTSEQIPWLANIQSLTGISLKDNVDEQKTLAREEEGTKISNRSAILDYPTALFISNIVNVNCK